MTIKRNRSFTVRTIGSTIVVPIIVALIALESLSYLATKNKLFLFNGVPGVYSGNNYPDIVLGQTEIEPWGAWHVPGATFRHSSECFDITMTFNEVGARDNTFDNSPENSLVLLGDSFAEGFGVSYESTAQYILESHLDRKILNFGASGNIGPLQELIIYQHFREYPHSGLVIFVLPRNDFTDNDRNEWSGQTHRYRPYFSTTGNPLQPYYFPDAIPKDGWGEMAYLKSFVKRYLWSSNAIRTLKAIIAGEARFVDMPKSEPDAKRTGYGYYRATESQQRNFLLAYNEIAMLSGERDILFVLIPSGDDILRYRIENDDDSYKLRTWYRGLQQLTSGRDKTVSVLDLLEHLPRHTEQLFLDCDPHWGPGGNAWSATVIGRHIVENRLFVK